MISGDKSMQPGNARYDLQRSAVDDLQVVYWGRESLRPRIPAGTFDVVTVQDPFWRGLFAWRVAHRLHAKLNVQVHTDLFAYGWCKRMLACFVLRRAYSVRVVSGNIQQQVEALGVTVPMHVLPVYTDVNRFKNVAHTPHHTKTIVWIGRFEDEKDPVGAIAVYKEVLAIMPDAKLIMLGKGSLEVSLKRKARGLAVEFPG